MIVSVLYHPDGRSLHYPSIHVRKIAVTGSTTSKNVTTGIIMIGTITGIRKRDQAGIIIEKLSAVGNGKDIDIPLLTHPFAHIAFLLNLVPNCTKNITKKKRNTGQDQGHVNMKDTGDPKNAMDITGVDPGIGMDEDD